MAEVSIINLVKIILLLSCSLCPFGTSQSSFTCKEQIESGFNALSKFIVYDIDFREYANNYFDQWSSTSAHSTEIEDFLKSLDEESALPDSNYINIVIDTVFETAYKPSLGFPYQYIDVDMEEVAKAGTETHTITRQSIRSTDDIMKRTPCKLDNLSDVENRIVFGSKGKLQYVNVLVSEYFRNNKYGCVEFSMIPSRMHTAMRVKKNFDSYYFQVTCFINIETGETEFHRIGTELLFHGPHPVTDTLSIFTNR